MTDEQFFFVTVDRETKDKIQFEWNPVLIPKTYCLDSPDVFGWCSEGIFVLFHGFLRVYPNLYDWIWIFLLSAGSKIFLWRFCFTAVKLNLIPQETGTFVIFLFVLNPFPVWFSTGLNDVKDDVYNKELRIYLSLSSSGLILFFSAPWVNRLFPRHCGDLRGLTTHRAWKLIPSHRTPVSRASQGSAPTLQFSATMTRDVDRLAGVLFQRDSPQEKQPHPGRSQFFNWNKK